MDTDRVRMHMHMHMHMRMTWTCTSTSMHMRMHMRMRMHIDSYVGMWTPSTLVGSHPAGSEQQRLDQSGDSDAARRHVLSVSGCHV